MKKLFLFCIVLMMSACAQLPGFGPSIDAKDKSKGILAASVTYSSSTRTMNAWFYIRKKGASDKSDAIRLAAKSSLAASSSVGLGAMLRNIEFPDTPNRDGRIVVESLEPGEYELYTWTLYTQAFGGYGYISPTTPPPVIPFTVTAGSVTYLGNLHGETVMGKNLLGLEVPASGYPEITDKSQRDLPMLVDKYPGLQDWPVINAHLNGQAWLPQPQPQ